MPSGGDPVLAADVDLAAGEYVIGNAEPTNNNSTTLTDDISLLIPSAGAWAVYGAYFFRSTAAAGLKIAVVGDGSGVVDGNIRWGIEGITTMVFGGSSLAVTASGTGFFRAFMQAYLTATASGAMKIRYAQNTSNAGPTGPLAGRWLRAVKVS